MSEKENISSELSLGSGETLKHISSTSRLSEDYLETFITIPPDGGWGWMVVVGSFFCNFVVDGSLYTFGVFLSDISATFNTEPTKVSLANSVMSGVSMVSGPIACAVVNRLGFQLTGLVGGFMAAAAMALSTLMTDLTGFIIVYGGIGGFSFGLIYLPSVVVIGFYFEKWRALATSVAVSGSALGILGFPLLVKALLPNFPWQFKFRLIAGLYFLSGCLALLYLPLKPTRVLINKDKKVVEVLTSLEEENVGFLKKIYNKFHNIKYPTHAQIRRDSTYLMYVDPSATSASSIFVSSVAEGSLSTFFNAAASKSVLDARSDKFDKLSTVYEVESPIKQNCCEKMCKYCKQCCRAPVANRPMYRDDIFYGASLFTLPEYAAQSKTSQVSKIRAVDYTMSVTRVDLLTDEEEKQVYWKCCHVAVVRTLVTMLNFQLLKSPAFLLLVISGFITVLGIYIPYLYMIERATEIDISEDLSVYFYTAVGISNGVGRVLSGVASSIPHAKCLVVSYVTLLICGISTIVSYFLRDVLSHFIYATIFGLTIASFSSLRAPLVVELLGIELLTNAFGLLLLFHGIAAFIGVPVAGAIINAANSYNVSFLYAGTCLVVSALILIPVKRISEWKTEI